MILGIVIDSVWATKKIPALTGQALLLVAPQSMSGPPLVAADCVGAGVGETVLLVSGSAARLAAGMDCPADAAIVGIIDPK